MLLVYLSAAVGSTFLLEQPSSSLLSFHTRFQELLTVWRKWIVATRRLDWFQLYVCIVHAWDPGIFFPCCPWSKVWKQNFWMLHFASPTPKRTSLYSNSSYVDLFDLGSITREQIKACKVRSTDSYIDAKGKKRFKGNKHLKNTQYLD